MTWIVLPLTAALAAVAALATVDVFISVKIVVVVDIDVAAIIPVAIAPGAAGPSTQRKSGRAPCQPHPGIVPRIGIRVIGIGRGSSSVNHHRVV